MDKALLIEQLTTKLQEALAIAERARDDAAEEAREGATPSEKRDDARVAIEQSGIARAQARRAAQLRAELKALETFDPDPLPNNAPVSLGALVEVEQEDGGVTVFLAPAGAGEELTGPGGDGFFTVVTPKSPIGSAVLGKREGDSASARIRGEVREWTVVWVG